MAGAFLAGYLLLGLITAIIVAGVGKATTDESDAVFVGLIAGLIFPVTIMIAIVSMGSEAVSEVIEESEK